MKVEDIKKFLEFRKKFTKREWFEINKAVDDQENKRADQIILDDSDVEQIFNKIINDPFTDVTTEWILGLFCTSRLLVLLYKIFREVGSIIERKTNY